MTNGEVASSDQDPLLLAQVRESFGRVAYSHKTHEKQADICFGRHRWQQGALITLTAASSTTFLATVVGLFGHSVATSLATSSIALAVTWITLGTKTFKFAEEADDHRRVASELWDVRESYISLIADLMSGTVTHTEIREKRNELQEKARAAYSGAPRTSSKAYTRAGDAIKNKEELTFTSREIDLLLPEALRLNESQA
ncbi:SLATT domain-containing protein [Klebsiella pneumoniae]|nr:SLATT domain-containing protein [Klebsiella pneumoniae]RNQ02778.1 SLATT domain-containing protein [Klebsiella pneumoniae]